MNRSHELHGSSDDLEGAPDLPPDTGSPDPRASLLLSGSEDGVLARIVPGDPLEIAGRVARRLEARALILDPRRALRRVLTLVAWDAAERWRRPWPGEAPAGDPWQDLDPWLDERVERAVEELLSECARGASHAGSSPDDEPDAWEDAVGSRDLLDLSSLATPLGLDPRELQSSCARFHRLELADRRALNAILFGARPATRESRSSEPGARRDSGAGDSSTPSLASGATRFERNARHGDPAPAGNGDLEGARRALRALCLPPADEDSPDSPDPLRPAAPTVHPSPPRVP